jgi:hypothetical protein
MNDETEFDKLPPAEQIARLSRLTYCMQPKDVARALILQTGNVNLARDRLQDLRKLLAEAEVFLAR